MPAFPDRVRIDLPGKPQRNADTGNLRPAGQATTDNDVPAQITRQASQRQNQRDEAGQDTVVADWVMLLPADAQISVNATVTATSGPYTDYRFIVTDLPAPRRAPGRGRAAYLAVPMRYVSDMQGASA
jgi:hypothetical protein